MMDWRDATISAGVNPGWVPLVDELHRRVTKIAPEIRVDQVKEKFGQLRYYYHLPVEVAEREVESVPWAENVGEAVEWIVGQAETVSAWICEVCGAIGHTSDWGHGWLNTLCEKHGAIRRDAGTPAWRIAEDEGGDASG